MRSGLTVVVVAGLSVAVLVGAARASAAPAIAASTAATTNVIVNMTEFKFALSRRAAPRGVVVFRVANKGETGHDFKIKGRRTPIYNPGRRGILRVTFTKRGRYPYICTVPGHAAAGMKGVLTIR